MRVCVFTDISHPSEKNRMSASVDILYNAWRNAPAGMSDFIRNANGHDRSKRVCTIYI